MASEMRVLLVGFTLLSSCAPAVPLFGGGGATPEHRTDLLGGAAARISVRPDTLPDVLGSSVPASGGASGVAAVLGLRHGVARHWDVEAVVAGTTGRLGVRHEWTFREAITRPSVLLGAGLLGGYVHDEGLPGVPGEGSGLRVGAEVPLLYAVEFGGVYDLWVGPRIGLEYLGGKFTDGATMDATRAEALVFRAGGVLGLALGLRRVHALLEVAAHYEHWSGDHGNLSLDDGGFVVVPAFALRVRL